VTEIVLLTTFAVPVPALEVNEPPDKVIAPEPSEPAAPATNEPPLTA
jgi:hypothetical protein